MKKIHLLICTIFVSLFSFAQNPVANFSTSSPSSGCSPITVVFQDLSSGNPTAWLWDFGNGNTSSQQNPSAQYSTPGSYTVKLRVTNAQGSDSITRVNFVKVFANPVASFTAAPNVICQGGTISFNDSSTLGSAPIETWFWSYGDGDTASNSTGNSIHTYNSALAGNFSVTLVVTDTNGCTSNSLQTISIIQKPTLAFTGTPLASCTTPLTVSFTNGTSGASPNAVYTWYFGDGTSQTSPNAQHTYTAGGSYTVSLVLNDANCNDSIAIPNYIVIAGASASFSIDDTVACVGQSVNFTNLSLPAPAIASWNFGDGGTSTSISPSHVYSTPGVYTVRMSFSDATGCTDSTTRTITIVPLPVITATVNDSTICDHGIPALFNASGTGVTSWQWSFGDGNSSTLQNPSHNFSLDTIYNVTVTGTDNNGCSATKTITIYIDEPNAFFNGAPRQGCVPHSLIIYSQSVSLYDSIVSYQWNFGNGQTATGINDTAFYNLPGDYDVTLVITTASGCTDTIVRPGFVQTGVLPTVNFSYSPDTVCYGDPVTFTNLSTGFDSTAWSFGVYNSNNPSFIFNSPGTYSVSLTACDNGCCDTLTLDSIITVLPPKPVFNATYNCTNPLSVSLQSFSIGADSLVWDFGDGSPINATNVTSVVHSFPSRGNYYVKLEAFNFSTGCSYKDSSLISVRVPDANFTATPLSGCAPLKVVFNGSTSQDASQYSWTFDNGTVTPYKTTFLDSIVYTTPGLYSPKLTIIDIHGCIDSVRIPNYINAIGPRVGFTVSNTQGCAPLTVTLTDTSVSSLPITQYYWNLGNGTIQITTVPTLTYTYTTIGTWTITLRLTDSLGCQQLTTRGPIRVIRPQPSITVPANACRDASVNFNASATNTLPGSTYAWVFGDGNSTTNTSNTINHTYANNGTYNWSLTVTDTAGCDSTVTGTIVINTPSGTFTIVESQQCGQNTFTLNPNTPGATSYLWTLTTGTNSSVQQNPTFTLTTPGIYGATLITTNSFGCSDTIVADSLIVVPGPRGQFNFTPQAGCAPLTVNFTATGNDIFQYQWDFGDGNVVTTTVPFVTHTYTNSNLSAIPQLIVSGTFGSDSCDANALNLTGTLTIQTISNVDVLDQNAVVVDTVFIGPGASFNLTAQAQNATNPDYHWTTNNSSIIILCDTCTSTSISTTSNGYLYITATQTNGGTTCSVIDSVYVVYTPCLAISFQIENEGIAIDSLLLQLGSSTTLNVVVNGGNAINYSWSPSLGLSCTNCANPTVTGNGETIWYVVTVSDTSGCQLIDSVRIVGFDCVEIDAIGNIFTPNGDGINDLFFVENACPAEDYFLIIYNRWGQEMFETNDISEGWNGKNKGGNNASEGTYYYIMRAKAKTYRGAFELIR